MKILDIIDADDNNGEMVAQVQMNNGEEKELEIPRHWAICAYCCGEGSHSRHIGAITQDEWEHEWSREEQEAYIGGEYDTECEKCKRTGKVREIDFKAISDLEFRKVLKKHMEDLAREEENDRRTMRMESGDYTY